MKKGYDLRNRQFGLLTVLKRDSTRPKLTARYWLCICECGGKVINTSSNLISGKVKSCGCLKKQLLSTTKTVDITNKRFGKLTAIRKGLVSHGTYLWLCRCECGKEKYVSLNSLNSGATQSCGCLKKSFMSLGVEMFEKNNSHIYSLYKSKSKRLKIEFTLTKEEFVKIILQNCFYCGYLNIRNGVDRVDNARGYVKGNSVPCCKFCNVSKGSQSVESFALYLDRIYLLKQKPSLLIKNKLEDIIK